ncbi:MULTISPECIES: DhaKLM operon coactivator DhaQ [Bacillus]|uniref:DhaKLM operon coactivator DhaQ n=1 Tax=Bacillus wiedmannii TaxID=1890302 RepID=A0A2B6HU65_9BACI|nr:MULTISPECIES: DhaKLM operon coactivator DhaQ [Bacillus]MDF9663152.1 DhaKLM operon coactivator DhaQ [Bacillus wiedmannii]MDI6505495.1 DhaKLM operon coactivator DhaQ [Bacillus wiedmannii]MDI6511739.1 DhaKLM operon coactivator DhaQ [Bacillus wiedmannii]PFZ31040.1 DhaKLM operon coactivator DhaQ [Bacillus wiedmannii]PGC22042.1 DhaKLM operon coactivator DhaQ [Bacillus wiedmannii]
MKKIMNDVENVVQDMMHGFYFEHNEKVNYDETNNIIYVKDIEKLKQNVVIISGGGSGHEPADIGYVGKGMLTATVNGSIFTPPTVEQIIAATRLMPKDKSILFIIKNFKDDVANFLAAEQITKEEGRQIDHIIVNDDVSIEDDASFNKRRRGVAGTVFVQKILGAAALAGHSLDELTTLGHSITENLHTLGVALSPANDPVKGKASFTLNDDEVFYGVGIHGEKGYRKEALSSSEILAIELMNKLKSIYRWRKGDNFAILINGLGATPLMEQYIFANDIRRLCELEGLHITFVKVGTLLTSLDMKGVSLSLLKVEDLDWVKWLKERTETASW